MLGGVLLAAAAAGQPLSGVVFCQHPEKPVEVQVFAGTRAPWGLTPQGPPLVTTQAPCGQRFAFHVPAPPPWRVEVQVPGHVAAAFHLAEPSPLPPVWLPKAPSRTLEVGGSWRGSLQVWGSLAEARPWGRWVPVVPTTRLLRPGKVGFCAPKDASFSVWGQDEGGAFVRWEVGKGGHTLRFAPAWVTVRVVDENDQPVAGAWVAAEGAPAGAEGRTDAQGSARVALGSSQGDVVAWKPGVGVASAQATGQQPVRLALAPIPQVELVSAQPYRGLVVLPRPWVPFLHAGKREEGVPLLFLGGPLQLGLWAPGFGFARTAVEGRAVSVGVRLIPEGTVAVQVVDPQGNPVAGVPVFVDEPVRWSTWSAGPTVPSLLGRGVTDAQGVLEAPAEAGRVAVRAASPPWAEAQEEVEVPPGERVVQTLTLAPGVACRLQVTDPQGNPLAGVEAEVTRERTGRVRYGGLPQQVILQATSLLDGTLELKPLPPGPIRLRLAKSGFVTRTLELELPGEGKDLGVVTLEPGAPLAGRVVDERGEGVAHARIFLGSQGEALFGKAGEAGPDGSFVLPDQPRSGAVFLRAEKENGVSSRPLRVELPSPPVQLVIPAGRVLWGRVVRAADGKPITGAQVVATEVQARSLGGFSSMSFRSLGPGVQTDEDGAFRLEVGHGTSFELTVTAKGFRQMTRDVRLRAEEKPRPLVIALEEGLALGGRVKEPSGAPAVGVPVRLETWQEGQVGRAFTARGRAWSTLTDGEGAFRFEELPPGRYQVLAQTHEGLRAREVAEAGQEDLELQLEAAGTLTVVVQEPGGGPAAGARLEVWGPSGQDRTLTTDESGQARLASVAPGTYRVDVRHPGFAPAWRSVVVRPDQEARVTVTLAHGGVVEGVVKGLSPGELARCRVELGPTSVAPLPDGSFRLTDVPLGKQEVEARVGWAGRYRRVEVEVKAGAPAWVEVDFGAGLSVSGRVERQGKPQPGLMVVAGREEEGVTDTTDTEGRFRLRGLEPGSWTLSVADTNGQVLFRQTLDLRTDRHLEVVLPAGQLAGRVVVAGTREPVVEATVALSQRGTTLRQETTGEDGRFLFADLPDGDFTVSAQAPGYGRASREVHLAAGQAPEVELPLPREAVLELFVQGMTGGAPERVWVSLADATGQTHQLSVPLDRRGRGVVPGLPPGTYGMMLEGFGVAAAVVTTPGQARVVLQPPGELVLKAPVDRGATVRVVFPEGLPVPLGWQADACGPVAVRAGQARSLRLPPGHYRVVSGSGSVTDVDVTGERPAVVEVP